MRQICCYAEVPMPMPFSLLVIYYVNVLVQEKKYIALWSVESYYVLKHENVQLKMYQKRHY